MSEDWTQADPHHWRKAVQTPYGTLTAEIEWFQPGPNGYSVLVQDPATNQNLTVYDFYTLEEAQTGGDALLAQFANEPFLISEGTVTPNDPSS
jgi:hypothetical protein